MNPSIDLGFHNQNKIESNNQYATNLIPKDIRLCNNFDPYYNIRTNTPLALGSFLKCILDFVYAFL